MRKEKELEKIIEETNIVLPMEFIVRTMRVLEIANSHMEQDTEQSDLTSSYGNTLFNEINRYISSEELDIALEKEIIGEL